MCGSKSNYAKHGVSFLEARTVFVDVHALLLHDPDHSDLEDRFIILGYSGLGRVLTVIHCERTGDTGQDLIRIISARKATQSERHCYQQRKGR